MVANPHRGRLNITIDGKTVVMFFGWEGVALLREEFGDDFLETIMTALGTVDMPVIAKVMRIGLRESLPGLSEDDLQNLPINVCLDAVRRSLNVTFWGTEEAAEEQSENPLRRLVTGVKKILSSLLWRPRSKPV